MQGRVPVCKRGEGVQGRGAKGGVRALKGVTERDKCQLNILKGGRKVGAGPKHRVRGY